MKLKGKTALITGASSGIGKAQALLLAGEGAQIMAAGRDKIRLAAVVDEIRKNGGQASAYCTHVEKSSQVEELVRITLEQFGKIDILCNTAGIFDYYAKSMETAEESWQQYFDVNVKGMYLVTNAVLVDMLQRGRGVIINMASIAGLTAGGGGSAYVASKHAVVGYTKQLCLEYAEKGIRVNAIAPGSVITEMHQKFIESDPEFIPKRLALIPAKRLGLPMDIAKLTVFLASDDADYIHGAVISIDGGRSAKG